MTNQQIDKLLEAYASGNINKLITFIDDEQLKNQLDNFFSYNRKVLLFRV